MSKRYSRQIPVFVVFALVALLCGCSYLTGGDGHSEKAPIPYLKNHIKAKAHQWHKDNSQDFENLRRMADEKGWKLVVAGSHTVSKLDLSTSECTEIYETKNWIRQASIQPGGAISVVEAIRGRSSDCANGEIVIIEPGGEKIRVALKLPDPYGPDIGGNPVLLTGDRLVFQDDRYVVSQDLVSGDRRVLLTCDDDKFLLTARDAGGVLCMVVVDRDRTPAGSRMYLVDKARGSRGIRSTPGVTNAIVVGDELVIERNGEIVSYDASRGDSRHLGTGALLTAIGNSSFLFADSSWLVNRFGWLGLEFTLKQFEIAANSSKTIAGRFSIDTCYGVSCPIPTPDSEYVVVADNSDSALVDSRYFLYSLASGRKAGAFYEPYNGECYFRQVLGWSE